MSEGDDIETPCSVNGRMFSVCGACNLRSWHRFPGLFNVEQRYLRVSARNAFTCFWRIRLRWTSVIVRTTILKRSAARIKHVLEMRIEATIINPTREHYCSINSYSYSTLSFCFSAHATQINFSAANEMKTRPLSLVLNSEKISVSACCEINVHCFATHYRNTLSQEISSSRAGASYLFLTRWTFCKARPRLENFSVIWNDSQSCLYTRIPVDNSHGTLETFRRSAGIAAASVPARMLVV